MMRLEFSSIAILTIPRVAPDGFAAAGFSVLTGRAFFPTALRRSHIWMIPVEAPAAATCRDPPTNATLDTFIAVF